MMEAPITVCTGRPNESCPDEGVSLSNRSYRVPSALLLPTPSEPVRPCSSSCASKRLRSPGWSTYSVQFQLESAAIEEGRISISFRYPCEVSGRTYHWHSPPGLRGSPGRYRAATK